MVNSTYIPAVLADAILNAELLGPVDPSFGAIARDTPAGAEARMAIIGLAIGVIFARGAPRAISWGTEW